MLLLSVNRYETTMHTQMLGEISTNGGISSTSRESGAWSRESGVDSH